jgi:hypothetical protein
LGKPSDDLSVRIKEAHRFAPAGKKLLEKGRTSVLSELGNGVSRLLGRRDESGVQPHSAVRPSDPGFRRLHDGGKTDLEKGRLKTSEGSNDDTPRHREPQPGGEIQSALLVHCDRQGGLRAERQACHALEPGTVLSEKGDRAVVTGHDQASTAACKVRFERPQQLGAPRRSATREAARTKARTESRRGAQSSQRGDQEPAPTQRSDRDERLPEVSIDHQSVERAAPRPDPKRVLVRGRDREGGEIRADGFLRPCCDSSGVHLAPLRS